MSPEILEIEMNVRIASLVIASAGLTMALALSAPAAAQAVDAEAAEALFKDNECQKCHHATKAKKGPSLQKIATKYREKGWKEAEAITHMTAGKKVKVDDSTEEDHRILNTKDKNAQANLARWILSR